MITTLCCVTSVKISDGIYIGTPDRCIERMNGGIEMFLLKKECEDEKGQVSNLTKTPKSSSHLGC